MVDTAQAVRQVESGVILEPSEYFAPLLFNADGKAIIALARPPSIYWRFAMLFFDCWQQASSIQYI
jgi:hypothetical protein